MNTTTKPEPDNATCEDWDDSFSHYLDLTTFEHGLCGAPRNGRPIKPAEMQSKPFCPICVALDKAGL